MAVEFVKRLIKAGVRLTGHEIRRHLTEAEIAKARKPVEPPPPVDIFRTARYDEVLRLSLGHFVEQLKIWEVQDILDVGSNTGQFVGEVRSVGYDGRIVSFEPLSAAHAQLVERAGSDPNWTVAERAAVGARPGEAQINIAGNSYSSSLLPMLDKHIAGAPEAAYTGSESCPVIRLDDYLDERLPGDGPLGLKIDTQGFEDHVLAGIERHLPRVKVVVLEMSLSPMYAEAPGVERLHQWLTAHGLACVALYPEFVDPRTGEILQVNGLYARLHPATLAARVAAIEAAKQAVLEAERAAAELAAKSPHKKVA